VKLSVYAPSALHDLTPGEVERFAGDDLADDDAPACAVTVAALDRRRTRSDIELAPKAGKHFRLAG